MPVVICRPEFKLGACKSAASEQIYYTIFDVLSIILNVTYTQCLAPKYYRFWLPLSVCKPQMLSVDRCAVPFTNGIVYYPPNCTCMLQPLALSIIKCFKQFYRKHQALEDVYLMDSGKNNELPTVLQVTYFTIVVC
jgi:DDE superfamily endonuclease.